MTKTGPKKSVPVDHYKSRLISAKKYMKAAEVELALYEEIQDANPAMSQMIISLIAFCDAITARYTGTINQKDHQQLPKLLKKALGNQLSERQERFVRGLLRKKDGIQYDAKPRSKAEADKVLVELKDFGRWAEDIVRR